MSEYRVRFQAPRPQLTMQRRWELMRDLSDAGVWMMQENLRRRYPDADDQELALLLDRWFQHRPGALAGDGPQPKDLSCRKSSP